MKTSAPRLVLGAAALLAVLTVNARAGLIHRYDFTADAKDLVGTADGTLEAGAGIADGQAVLDGSAAYVNFPNNLLTNLLTFWR